jgi:hypothetical protein
MATRRISAKIAKGVLHVNVEGAPAQTWQLPAQDDTAGIREVQKAAVAFARDNGATVGQQNAVRKAFSKAGYYLRK